MKRLLALMLCAVSLGSAAQTPLSNSCQLLTESGELVMSTSSDLTEESLIFDGDFVQMAPNLDMTFDSQLSLTAWVKIPQNPNDWNTLFGGYYDYGVNLYAGSNNSEGAVRIELHGVLTLTGEFDLRDNQWHHVSVVYDGSQLAIWIDGVIDASQYASGGIQIPNESYEGGDFFLGRGNHAAEYFEGGMAFVSLWDIALTPEDIQQQKQCHRAIDEETAVAHWKFEEDEGNVVMDFSGGGNHGQINGAVFSSDAPDQACYSSSEIVSLCGPGTIWDAEMQMCIGDGSGDINLDGCVQLNDLLDLLSAYGDCGSEESTWQCGDPLEYQGYDYETVQIGEQCWFAENLRAENYSNGDAIASDLGNSEWEAFTEGATTVYNNDPNSFDLYGRLYNSYAVEDSRKLCPFEWKVPSDSDWMLLEMELGMTEEIASMTYHRGLNEGLQLKSSFGWFEGGNGTNVTGFSALPGGVRDDDGDFSLAGERGHWWSSTPVASSLWYRRLDFNDDRIYRWYIIQQPDALSVRCIKDTE